MTNPPWGPPDPSQGQPPQQPWGPPDPSQGQPPPQQYPPPEYSQQQYPPPPEYGQQQYPPPEYGQQQYPPPEYSQQQYPPPEYGQQQRSGKRKGLWAGLGAVVVAGVVVLILALTGVFSSDDGSTGGSTPAAAVTAVLEGYKQQDQDAVLKHLCAADVAKANPKAGGFDKRQAISGYEIGKTSQRDGSHATVSFTVRTTGGQSSAAKFAVVKESGEWRVCITDTIRDGLEDSPTGGETP